MISAITTLGLLGLIIGAILAAASKIFYVYVDPKILEVEDALPGANCGGCGLPGCGANAEAIVAGKAGPDSCVAGGSELAIIIAALMGVKVEAKEPDIARPGCYYSVEKAEQKYIYDGLGDCRAATLLSGGMKVCTIGCLGLGTCAKACPFNAIQMGPEGLPVVNEKRCTGCGTCERVCPKHIITLSSVTRRILREYTTDECSTPCQRKCPAGINIREYIRHISLGNYMRAVQVIKERNPFPTVIGRICPRPCEEECRRKYMDEPVAINFLKRFAADCERAGGERILPYKAPDTGRKIAIVGGGVEGLSTAFFAARLGHAPTVFEATDKLGGLLRSAISFHRLPREILDWDINGIVDMGVDIKTEQPLGTTNTIHSLLSQGFDAVFTAGGGWDSRSARKAEHHTDVWDEQMIPGTYLLIDLFKHHEQITCQSDVAIVGGGRSALEAARICKKNGARRVTIILRESPHEFALTADEHAQLAKEDIKLITRAGIVRIIGEQDHLKELVYDDLDSHAQASLPIQNLFFATGRFPELIFQRVRPPQDDAQPDQDQDEKDTADQTLAQEEQLETLLWEGLEPYKRPVAYHETGLFAQGDVLSDFSGAIKAIGAGRRAAASIHQVMYGIVPSLPEEVLKPESFIQNVHQVRQVAAQTRQIMPLCNVKNPAGRNEIELGFTQDQAQAEAERCLQCGLICYEQKQTDLACEEAAAS